MYVITGATGNTGLRISEALLKAGKTVKVVSRDEKRLKPLIDQGAIPAVGELEDADFLTKAFEGATAVYALIPPKWDLTEPWRNYQRRVGQALTTAIEKNAVPYVVVLSSNGAQLPEGAGPVTGLYEFEQMLKAVPGLNIMNLRAGFFMQNLYANIGMIKQLGFFGYSLKADVKIPFVHTNDIADVAIKHLLALDFEGFNYVFVPGERDLSMPEAAKVLGEAIAKPDLHYVAFSESDAKAGMLQAGIPETIADGYVELFNCLNNSEYLNDFVRTPENSTPTSIEDFAKEFAAAYQNS
ncbi:MAG: NmrA family NAD(P)-binding protein [Microscillaceae bacterium]|nr:NmrA family NAD(P)-binding protein [Microscillaceae bacterium]